MTGIRPFDARALLAAPDRAAARAFTKRCATKGGCRAARRGDPRLGARLRPHRRHRHRARGDADRAVDGAARRRPGGRPDLRVPPRHRTGRPGRRSALRHPRASPIEEKRWRLAGFGRDVGMEYVPAVREPDLPGSLFSIGSGRVASDILRGREPRFVEVGDYSYVVSNGKNSQTVRWGYIAIRLDVPLPHIVLDATANDGVFGSNLPVSLARGQRLSLEGDFDRHFRLFCPRATNAMRSTCSPPTSWHASSTTHPSSMSRSSTTGCSCTPARSCRRRTRPDGRGCSP